MRETGRVVLGMPGPWAEDNHEVADHYTTKIGGVPDWPTLDINPDMVKCRLCGERLYLVAQVYSPISSGSSKVEDRTIYVLGCPRPKCASSCDGWRTLRVQKARSESQSRARIQDGKLPDEQLTSTSSSVNDWWATGDASDEEMDLMKLSQAISEASSLVHCTKKQNEPIFSEVVPKMKPICNDSSIHVLPCFYLYEEEEKFSDRINNIHQQCSSLSIKDSPSLPADFPDEERWEAESYEYDRALGADRTYLKFKKRLEAHPEQCISSCEICGAQRHYEMQLMPPLLFFLQQAADDRGDCWAVAEESTVVQWE
ncbi:unnamed protein product [Spirodela intermedia]|uniref:Uncharacterized protein n=1 Tax=Spirodela intermedia TaxID=51605 RepID=A0A7I8J503_SPIIN|nr:unnamed protein product [Spirodela intermedia]CAA6665134.1 unnamed protein product [Spirodela intermedia]